MDINNYISSGILERFVLGDCSPQEEKEVLQMRNQHPEINAEIELIEDTFFNIDKAFAVKPSDNAKEKLMNSLFGKDEKIIDLPKSTVTEQKIETGSTQNTEIKTFKFGQYGIAASWAALIVSVSLNVIQYTQLSENKALVQTQFAQNEQLEQELQTVSAKMEESNNYIAQISKELPLYRNPETVLTKMQGTALDPNASALVVWNSNLGKAYLDASTLPELPSDKQYQLWALIDGKPIDMGVFELDFSSPFLQEVPFIAGAQAYAVTIETAGGNPTPNLDQLIVIGTV